MLIANVTTNASYRPLFSNVASGGTASTLQAATTFTFNPSNGVLAVPTLNATTLSGALTGNASSCSQVALTSTTVASDRFVMFTPNTATTTAADVQIASLAANAIKVQPSVPSLTIGATTGGTGIITCNSFVGNLTGNASSSSQVALTSTVVANDRYLMFTPNSATTTAADVQIASLAASAIKVQPSIPSLTLGAGIAGTGIITSASFVGALTGNASSATQISLSSTSVASDRYLVFCQAATVGSLQYCDLAADVIKCNPSVPSLTIGATTSGTGVITCNSFVGALTGNASSSTQVFTQSTAVSASRYLTMSLDNATNTASTLQTATQLMYNPGTQLLTVPNLTVSGTITGTFSVRGYVVPFSSSGIVAGYQFASVGLNGLTTVVASSGINTKFAVPIAGTIGGMSILWATGSATATVSIYKNGVAASTSAAIFSATAAAGTTATISGLAITVTANDYIEVKTNVANLGSMTANVYFT